MDFLNYLNIAAHKSTNKLIKDDIDIDINIDNILNTNNLALKNNKNDINKMNKTNNVVNLNNIDGLNNIDNINQCYNLTWYNHEDNCIYFYDSEYNDFISNLLSKNNLQVNFITNDKYLSYLKINSSDALDLFQYINDVLNNNDSNEFTYMDKVILSYIINNIYNTINHIYTTPKLIFSIFDKQLSDITVIPFKKKGSDVGYDLTLIKKIDTCGDMEIYTTNIAVEPTIGFYTETVVRSSFYKTGYIQMNAVGIIDPGYRGPLNVVLYKVDKLKPNLQLPFRYGQLILKKYNICVSSVTNNLSSSARNVGGFGSTN